MDTLYPDMTSEQKEQMWDKIADWLSIPEEDRKPRFQKELYEALQIPESTFYLKLQDEDFMRKVVRKGLIKAKKSLPKMLQILEKNAYEGKEKSLEMFFKYVAEQADRLDHTTKGEKITELTDKQKAVLDTLLKPNEPASP